MQGTTALVAGALVGLLLWHCAEDAPRRRRPRPRRAASLPKKRVHWADELTEQREQREAFEVPGGQEMLQVNGTHVRSGVPLPAPSGTPQSPLTPYIQKAIDSLLTGPAAGTPQPVSVPEMRQALTRVLDRINARSPGLNLVLVSVDAPAALRTPQGTTVYTAIAHVHSPTKMFSSAMSVRLDVSPNGEEIVRDLSVRNAGQEPPLLDAAGPATFAAYEPVARYVPKI